MTIYYKPFISENFESIAKRLGLKSVDIGESAGRVPFVLYEKEGLIYLSPKDASLGGDLACDFSSHDYRQYAKTMTLKMPLAKACGCKSGLRPSVLDLTAGLGRDSFALASLGCDVSLVEKNPVVYMLLYAGFENAKRSPSTVSDVLMDQMRLLPCQPAIEVLTNLDMPKVDTVYIDPMFPERKKSAKVKKAMQYFHQVVGEDDNEPAALLDAALKKALNRVVIKRPKGSGLYADIQPNLSIPSKGLRFDIYFPAS